MEKKLIYVKEFWEWQKNIYGMYKQAKQSKEKLLDFVDKKPKENEYKFRTEKHEKIKLNSIVGGKFFGKDHLGNDIQGDVDELKKR